MKTSAINCYQPFTATGQTAAEKPKSFPSAEHKHKPVNPVSVTGWVGVASVCTAVISAIAHKPKLHKISAFAGIAAIASHVGLVSARHHSFKPDSTHGA